MTPARSWRCLIFASTLGTMTAVAAFPEGRATAAMNETSLHGAGSTFSATLYNQWIVWTD